MLLTYLVFFWIMSLRTILISKCVHVHSKCVWAYLWVYMTHTSQLFGAQHLLGSYYFTILCYISSFYFALPVIMLNTGGTNSRQSIEQLPGEKIERKWLNDWRLTLKRIVLQLTIAVYLRNKISDKYMISSVQFSRSVVSDSLRPHESQHARPPCPSPTPRVHSDSRPSTQ